MVHIRRPDVEVEMPEEKENYFKKIAAPKVAEAVAANDMKAAWMTELADLNVCSQKGLVEMFDGSIGAGQRLHAISVENTSLQRHSPWLQSFRYAKGRLRYRDHDELMVLIHIYQAGAHTTDAVYAVLESVVTES